VIVFPNAKLNLGLHITEKRPDGFHNIETVFYPAHLCDALEMIPSEEKGVQFTVSGLPLPGDPEENLVLKAVKLLSDTVTPRRDLRGVYPAESRASRYPMPDTAVAFSGGVNIHLHKVIPPGSGLGGGSSDAAYALKLLNDLWKLDLTNRELQDLARRLGSDCAFFIENKPVLASGRGDRFEPLDLDLTGYRIEIMVPPVHVSTPEAYGMVTPRKPERLLREVIQLPVREWKGNLVNDFEEPVMKKYPLIREAKEELYHRGALYASMSGSGSAVYGIFDTGCRMPDA